MTEDEIVQFSDLEKLQERLPFVIFIPSEMELRNVTYRKQGRKWATLRYECTISGEELRVKEFFLDWFYPGFPKSLMDSFISSYSDVESSVHDDRVVFFGKNYKGKNASSSFSLGTQIEIEGGTKSKIKKLSEMMIAPSLGERFRSYPFYERSFFANHGEPEWFEEERISNLSWRPPSKKLCVGNLCVDSIGILKKNGLTKETIFAFSEEFYRRAAWVDIAESNSGVEHLIYDLRKGGNFFDEFEEGEPTMAFRQDSGPTIARFKGKDSVTTISLSPLFRLSETKRVVKDLLEAVENPEKFI